MNHSPAKILVMRLSSLGDVVHATAALAPLQQAGAEIDFVTKEAFAPLLHNHPAIKFVYPYPKRPREREAREEFFRWFARQGFTHVLDLHDSWRTRLWRGRLRRSAQVIVARKPRFREWLILFLRLGSWFGFEPGGRAQYYRDAALALAKSIGAQEFQEAPLTTLAVTAGEVANLRGKIPAGDFLVLLPTSAWRQKMWPYFAELAAKARVPVVTLGAESDFSCDAVAAASLNKESRSLRGQTTLRESLAVLSQARWIVGNDTGMVHVAEALGKSVAVIEGPTHTFMGFSPYAKASLRIGLPLVCRPCSKSGRVCVRFGLRTCLKGLKADAVAAELREAGYPC